LNGQPFLYFLISLMILLWSANFIIGKVALREFPPFLLSVLRLELAGLILAPVYWIKCRSGFRKLRGPDVMLLTILALCCMGNQLLFVIGLSRTTVAHSALIIATGPIFVLLIAAFMKLEKITPLKIVGMLIALAGVAVLVEQSYAQPGSAGSSGEPTLAGDALTALASTAFSVFAVLGKKATERYSSLAVNGFAYVAGGAMLIPVLVWQASAFPFAQVSPAAWSSLVYMALFPSVICYLIYYYALSRISASRVTAFIYLEPVLATLMAVAFLGERVTAQLIAGGTVIFAGVYLTERG
jgi:drug/metabolite transporter (DMT)-like permease